MSDIFGNGGRVTRYRWVKPTFAVLVGLALAVVIMMQVMITNSLKRIETGFADTVSSLLVNSNAGDYRNLTINADERLCEGAATSTMCQMVTLKKYDYGQHNDLWVMLDAGFVLFKDGLTDHKQRELAWIYQDVQRSLNGYGAFGSIVDANEYSDIPDTLDLYDATIAHALMCKARVSSLTCVNGLPSHVRNSLRRLAAFVEAEGPSAAPYNMRPRIGAVKVALAIM